MEVVKFADAPFYRLPDHEDVIARRLQGAPASTAGFAVLGHSYFRDGAVVPMGAGSIGKVYVVTEGTLVIEGTGGTRHVLQVMDSIFIAPGESRAIRNESGAAATMIVVTPPPNP